MPMFLALAALTVSAAAFAAPHTWIVDSNGGGDYTSIVQAVAAASDGDVILVRAGTYAGFTLDKKVTVKAETTVVQLLGPILIDSITAGSGGAVVSGFEVTGGEWPLISVSQCAGDVVLEMIELDDSSGPGSTSGIDIESSASVSIYDCHFAPLFGSFGPLVNVDHSTLRACRVDWTGGMSSFGGVGETAVSIYHSTLVLEEPKITGGVGIDSGGWAGHFEFEPGTGGLALYSNWGTIWIVGDESAVIQGGEGGSYIDYESGQKWYAKPGGAGLNLWNSDCFVSRCKVAGGQGYPDGPEYSHDPYTRDDSYPFLWLEPELHVGQSTTVKLDATSPGTAILLLSDQGGVDDAGPKWLGPPLAVLVGTTLYVEDLGNLDANGDWFETVNVPNDPSAAGMTWHLQAAVFAQSGTLYLTNPVARTIGL
jgi:hypothetical protein